MGHHGLLTAAESVAVAFDLHYYFEQVSSILGINAMGYYSVNFSSVTFLGSTRTCYCTFFCLQAAKVQVLGYQTGREMKLMQPEVVEAG